MEKNKITFSEALESVATGIYKARQIADSVRDRQILNDPKAPHLHLNQVDVSIPVELLSGMQEEMIIELQAAPVVAELIVQKLKDLLQAAIDEQEKELRSESISRDRAMSIKLLLSIWKNSLTESQLKKNQSVLESSLIQRLDRFYAKPVEAASEAMQSKVKEAIKEGVHLTLEGIFRNIITRLSERMKGPGGAVPDAKLVEQNLFRLNNVFEGNQAHTKIVDEVSAYAANVSFSSGSAMGGGDGLEMLLAQSGQASGTVINLRFSLTDGIVDAPDITLE